MNKLLSYIFFLMSFVGLGQQLDINTGLEYMRDGLFEKAIAHYQSLDTVGSTIEQKALWSFYLADAFNSDDKQDRAYELMLHAKELFKKLNAPKDVNDCNLMLLSIRSHQNDIVIDNSPILEEIQEYVDTYKDADPEIQFSVFLSIGSGYSDAKLYDKAIAVFEQSLALSTQLGDSAQMSYDNMNIGAMYQSKGENVKALAKANVALPYLLKTNDISSIAANYNNQARAYDSLGRFPEAIKLYLKADSLDIRENRRKTKAIFYENIGKLYQKINDYEKALEYLNKSYELTEETDDRLQSLKISVADTRSLLAEEKAERIIKEQESTRNQNIAYGLGGLLFLGTIIGFLVYRNTKRKQRIAEQEKEIEVQKTEKLLKDQELSTIDAMIAGQEKERQRLASDLHDSVGATLSAAKMQFEHLKKHRGKLDNEEEFYERTQMLLEEAYTEVRSMAHAKNSGVIAKHGLLPAVKKLARNASATGKLSVEVQDYGLDQRLEGSLEIAVFRIIQELVTNIIKHAEASEANISLTQHEDALNLVVEDNGKGFKVGKFTDKDGMGLGSIEKRVEHMEGQMEVDSTPGKGASVIIDIPL
ncbi:tetratricopeptide repeat-containing sensor histidine kinase [Gilvibacter sediminis]|uniref:tetratricopeptide repeat-containing sensor histidine kinase n=1 Tax=Gilvibacter sediminis TaxID=379071 RepID=UPI00234FE54C|nr:sensor histidine kinase [Gilvibacter sediminis]MDC7999325.1 sensor histidine kinase [Gilvibacter sediminis]